VSKLETTEFAPAVLQSLPVLVPSGMIQADLALELGLSAHIQMSATEVDDAMGQMWAIRQAVLEAGDMDASIEPIPFGGRSERLGLLNLAIYLGNLVDRAAAHQGCDRHTIVARALLRPVLHQVRRTAPEVRELRSS
jgi:hypothetical protein